MRKILLAMFLVAMALISVGPVFASGFNLKSIGSVDTNGLQINHWWYTSAQPTFRGIATPGAEVTITIDGTARMVNADSAGDWVFTPETALNDGDHAVSLASSGSTIDFTLTTGTANVDWDSVGKGGGEALPAAGTSWPTVLLMIVGVGVIGVSGKIVLNATKE